MVVVLGLPAELWTSPDLPDAFPRWLLLLLQLVHLSFPGIRSGVYILYSILLHSSFCIGSAALFSRPRNQVQPTLPLRIPLSLGLLFGTDADSSSDTSLLGSTRGRGDLRCSFEK